MDIQISRESGVPIRLQVGRQIALMIAAGKLKPGESLPSIRALANRLKIHYNTVSEAYQDLAAYQLVERHRGSRMIVPFPGTRSAKNAPMDLDDVVNTAIKLAQDCGITLQQLGSGIQGRLLARPPDHLLVLSDDPGLRKLLRVELEQQLECRIATCSLSDLRANPALAVGALVVGSHGRMQVSEPLLPKNQPAYSIIFNSADEHVRLVRKLKEPSVIAVISVSEFFLLTARGLLAPALGRRHTLREYFLPSDKPRNLNAFSIVFCDSIARRSVKARNLVHYQLISPESLAHLARAVRPQ